MSTDALTPGETIPGFADGAELNSSLMGKSSVFALRIAHSLTIAKSKVMEVKQMYKGWKQLTPKERKHIREMGIYTTYDMEQTFAKQKVMRQHAREVGALEPCWDCYAIAKKLGYEV